MLGPLLAALYLSLTSYNGIAAPRWIGIDNYRAALEDPLFWQSLKVTIIYTAASVPLGLTTSFALALFVNRFGPLSRSLQAVAYVPVAISGVPLAIVWLWIFNPDFGLLNYLLSVTLHVHGPRWLQSESWALPSLVVMTLWTSGGTMLIYLGGLRTVPRDLLDAAAVEGAGPLRTLWSVTLPLLSPILAFTAVVGLIGSFQIFTVAQVSTGGGPNYATLFYVLYTYNVAFRNFKIGYASALSWLLVLMVAMVILFWRFAYGRLVAQHVDG